MRKILDRMFSNTKLSIIIPLSLAAIVYFLFVFFGTSTEKSNIIITTPIISAIWFFGGFFVIYFQVKNPSCPEWFLNLFELLVTFSFGISAIINIVSFIVSGFQGFMPIHYISIVTYASVAWAHSKRAK